MNTKSKGPFLGVNNRRQKFDLHVDKVGDFIADGENIDIDGTGNIVRRSAYTLAQAMSNPHSLYTDDAGIRYLVRGAVLYRVTLPTYSESLVKVLTNDDAVSYVEFNGSLYYSNGTDSGRITGGSWYPWALPTPDEPALSSIAGALFSGHYLVSLGYSNIATGEEGGVSQAARFEVTTGGLRVALPAAVPGATHIAVFVSAVNGSVPMLQATVAVGTAQLDVTALAGGREVTQRFEAPLPAGRLFMHNGTLCSVAGKNIYRGIPFRPGYHIPSESRIPFPAEVTNAISAQAGVFITADKTYWFAGQDLADVQTAIVVLPYGAAKGTAFISPDKTIYGWFGEKGIVFGSLSGEVEAVMSDNIDLVPPASGVSAVFETRGYRRVVSCGWCLNLDNKAATRYADYEFSSISDGYGTLPDGIYRLDGVGPVDAFADLGDETFGTEYRKSMPAAYLGYASDSPLELAITSSDDEEEYRYPARSCSAKVKIHRVDPGLGLEGNSFLLAIRNTDGADFTLASVSFADVASSRRI